VLRDLQPEVDAARQEYEFLDAQWRAIASKRGSISSGLAPVGGDLERAKEQR
jgi:hypothetical protein